uniref:helix-turn-helix domain-containing protein n=1 Tax=Salinispora oceanensis TaxID=1050199 RepID=UPI0009B77D67
MRSPGRPLKAQGKGVWEISRAVGRDASTISRELRRNAATRGGRMDYRAVNAQWHAKRRSRRPKVAKLAASDRLRDYVQERLAGAINDAGGRPIPGPNATATWTSSSRTRRRPNASRGRNSIW